MNENDVIAVIIFAWLIVQVTRLTYAARARKRADMAKAAREYRQAAEKETA